MGRLESENRNSTLIAIRNTCRGLRRSREITAFPVLMHFQHETYNLGYERFHKMLEKYPKVNFIGHAQTFWGNIDKNHVQSVMYPKGPVTPGGIMTGFYRITPTCTATFGRFGAERLAAGRGSCSRDS